MDLKLQPDDAELLLKQLVMTEDELQLGQYYQDSSWALER